MRLISMTRLSARFLAFLLLLMPSAAAQGVPQGGHGSGDGYGPNRDATYPQEVQTTNSPAGTVVEPGSQLIFLLDTGVDATGFDPTTTLAGSGVTASALINLISITNTNPTDAVTVHFRYFNEDCTDVLDFLMVLTCNDTILVDPFDFMVPGTTVNVSQLFFGVEGVFPEPLPAGAFGTGRFLLYLMASGAAGNESGDARDTGPNGANTAPGYGGPEDLDKFADWLFPGSLAPENLPEECWAVDGSTIGVVSDVFGRVNDNNLTVFNASAISFNYLTGFHTVADPNTGTAYGVTAWTRPAVNLGRDLDPEDTSFDAYSGGAGPLPARSDLVNDFSPQDAVGAAPSPATWDTPKEPDGLFDFFDLYNIIDGGLDGDGPLAPKRCILSGSEEIWLTLKRNAALVLPANYFYLRQDAHGGDSIETNCEGFTPHSNRCDFDNPFFRIPVAGGALSWTLWPTFVSQSLYGLAAKDDYNGSGNATGFPLSIVDDSSYRLDAAVTYYELAIYNDNEELLEVPQEIEDISPQPPFTPPMTRVALRCIDYYTFENQIIPAGQLISGGSAVDFVLTRNLGTFDNQDLLTLDPVIPSFLAVPPINLSLGWVRFDRILTRDFWYDATSGSLLSFAEPYDGERGTYVTIAKNVVMLNPYAVSWYLPQAATEFAGGPKTQADREPSP